MCTYQALAVLELALAALTFIVLRFITAPYGRHGRGGWGPTVAAPIGWAAMEFPAPVLFTVVYAQGTHRGALVPLVLLAMWQSHYLYRAFGYPLLLRGARRMPVALVLLAIGFNTLNAWINASWVSQWGSYPTDWLTDPRFLLGLTLFVTGSVANRSSDRTLRGLRAPGETGYRIPRGGGYRWVSCPNYLGEIVAWTGWALATWSLAGVAFAAYTAANLVPRALDHHRWYRERFADYPAQRRALIPYLL